MSSVNTYLTEAIESKALAFLYHHSLHTHSPHFSCLSPNFPGEISLNLGQCLLLGPRVYIAKLCSRTDYLYFHDQFLVSSGDNDCLLFHLLLTYSNPRFYSSYISSVSLSDLLGILSSHEEVSQKACDLLPPGLVALKSPSL